MATETEVKYRVPDERVLDAVVQGPEVRALRLGETGTAQMRSRYYDTAGGTLSGRKWTLRVRRVDGRSVVTMKTPGTVRGGLHVRGEWECDGQDAREAVPELVRLGAPAALLEKTQAEPLVVLCGASFTRRTVPLRLPDGSTATLCADLGVLTGGGNETPLCELELELESGAAEQMLAFAAGLARRYALTPEPESKYVRALRTAGRSFAP